MHARTGARSRSTRWAARYVAQMFEAMGADGRITLEVHNVAALENIAEIWVCDSIPVPAQATASSEALRAKLQVASCIPLFADAMRRQHEGWRR
jgi:phosphoribosylpyrophosphate synthetase